MQASNPGPVAKIAHHHHTPHKQLSSLTNIVPCRAVPCHAPVQMVFKHRHLCHDFITRPHFRYPPQPPATFPPVGERLSKPVFVVPLGDTHG
ncbi:hypothetical protein WG66_006142, partial [Moniliophthora roreri]